MISASMGGDFPGNQPAATEPVAMMTFSPSPQPSGSKARRRELVSSTTTSRIEPAGTSESFLVDQMRPVTVALSI